MAIVQNNTGKPLEIVLKDGRVLRLNSRSRAEITAKDAGSSHVASCKQSGLIAVFESKKEAPKSPKKEVEKERPPLTKHKGQKTSRQPSEIPSGGDGTKEKD
jgi:hypothetical protein